MKIYYLYHSSFVLEFDQDVLVFDYYKDKPRYANLENGVFNPEEWTNKRVHVFVSHRHPDHFNNIIFTWPYTLRHVFYYLSHDVIPPKDLHNVTTVLQENREYDIRGIKIYTFLSNDEGVAMLLQFDKATIFYAGDLNWWAWPGDKSTVQKEMQESFCREIDTLASMNIPIDVAFLVLDPRMEQNYDLGFHYFMENIHPGAAIPMHMDGDTDWIERFAKSEKAIAYSQRIVSYEERGEQLKLPADVEEKLLTARELELIEEARRLQEEGEEQYFSHREGRRRWY